MPGKKPFEILERLRSVFPSFSITAHCIVVLDLSFLFRMGRLENASVEAQNMLAGLESQLGANHEATISALYLAG